VQFKGVCIQSPCYCIVMEYCPYGQLYDVMKNGRQIPPPLVVDWAKQISSGMQYLHSRRIIHRDLKSPNVLLSYNDTLKISDFGISRQWTDGDTKMSFGGTVSWMAPEVIRVESCSEKVDVWSFGVVLWELLTCEIPYKGVDQSAIMWGVGNNSLSLPIPDSMPDGFKLLLKQCWSIKPRHRPSFQQILMHLDIASSELLDLPANIYFLKQQTWRDFVNTCVGQMKRGHIVHREYDANVEVAREELELIKKRQEELQHAQDIREHYERKLEKVNNLYMEVNACLLQLERKERLLKAKEDKLSSQHTHQHTHNPLIPSAPVRMKVVSTNVSTNGRGWKTVTTDEVEVEQQLTPDSPANSSDNNPTANEALTNLDAIKKYLTSQETPDLPQQLLLVDHLEKIIRQTATSPRPEAPDDTPTSSSGQQKSITDYFKPHPPKHLGSLQYDL